MKKISSLLMVLLCIPFVLGVTLDLGKYSVENPLITVHYLTSVELDDATLSSLDPDNPESEYELNISPTTGFAETFTMTTEIAGEKHPLYPGDYQLTLFATDQQGDATVDNVLFEITGPSIVLIDPPFGIAQSHPYDVYFMTIQDGQPVSSTCEWSNLDFDTGLTPVDDSDGINHRIFNLDYQGFLYVVCEEDSGRETARRFTVGWDEDAPIITATATPNIVRDPRDKSTFITIDTDEDTVCTIDGEYFAGVDPGSEYDYDTHHEAKQYYNEITDEREHVFKHNIECTNLAGLSSEVLLEVTVNLGLFAYIDVLHPPQFTNESSFTLQVLPTFVADSCSVDGGTMTQNGDIFEKDYTGLPDGVRTFDLFCEGAEEAEREYNVTVDTEGPEMQSLSVPEISCESAITFSYNATDDGGVLSYTYTIFENDTVVDEKETISTRVEVYLPRGEFTLSVYATDKAGNNGVPLTDTFSILDATDPLCEQLSDCTTDLDCPTGHTCELGLCQAGATPCTSNLDCTSPDLCSNGFCIDPFGGSLPPEPPETPVDDPPLEGGPTLGCASDAECQIGEECRAGVCVPEGPSPTPRPLDDLPTAEGSFPWLALILIILGVLVMGGSGYYLYEQHQGKSGPPPTIPRGPPPGPTTDKAAEERAKATMMREQKAAVARKQKEKKRRSKRTQERHKVFKKFDTKKGKEDDVFEKLGKIGK